MNESLIAKLNAARGRRISDEDAARLKREIAWIPQWFVDLMRQYPLAGAVFALDENPDLSQRAVDLDWLTPSQIIDETRDAYPGIAAARERYVPFGSCALGTGETYFIRADDDERAVYLIPHDAVTDEDRLDVSQVERVCSSTDRFLEAARVK